MVCREAWSAIGVVEPKGSDGLVAVRVLILTFGTQGDVRPFVALAKGLRAAGHEAAVCTAEGFRSLVIGAGVDYVHMGNEMLDLVQSEMPRMGGVSDALRLVSRMSAAMRSALLDQWQAACEFRPSLLIYHPKMLGGLHIAERLQVPAVASLPLPFLTPTRAFPIPFIGHWPFGGLANKLSYQFNRFTAVAYGGMINSFRRETLGLSGMSRWSDYLRFPDGGPVPVLYGFSSHVVPVPADYPAHAHVTGYWFLDEPETWHPPTELVDFLAAGEAPVYIGFGSMGFGKHARTRVGSWSTLSRRPESVRWSLPAGAVSRWTRCPTVCTSSKRSRTPGCSPGLSAWFTTAEQARQLLACWRLVPLWSVPCWVIRVSGRSEYKIWAWGPHRCRWVD